MEVEDAMTMGAKSYAETAEITTVMSVMDERHGSQEVEGATKQKVEHWDVTTLTRWLNKALDPPLHSEDIEKIEKERIDGGVFLKGAGNPDFFMRASFSFGASVKNFLSWPKM